MSILPEIREVHTGEWRHGLDTGIRTAMELRVKVKYEAELMDNSRLNKSAYDWMCSKRSNRCKSWSFRLLKQLEKYSVQENSCNAVLDLSNAMFNDYKDRWLHGINSEQGASFIGMNKLRT